MLIMGIFAVFKLMRKKRRSKRSSPQYRRSKKDQAEFEMQPCMGRSPTYPLAFDNPYYDVVAVMGLDDDIEEDYENPLYDDVSVYSDSNYNSSTDDSIHKENLINSMVLSWTALRHYYNHLCDVSVHDDVSMYDDVSVYSDSNYNSSTDDSIHKENLINPTVLSWTAMRHYYNHLYDVSVYHDVSMYDDVSVDIDMNYIRSADDSILKENLIKSMALSWTAIRIYYNHLWRQRVWWR